MKLPFNIKSLFLTTILATMSSLAVFAEDGRQNKSLDIRSKYCLKTVAGYSMMGPTSTGVYYVFTNKKTVLLVNIDNKNKDFPVSAKIFTFDDSATQKGMEGWVNNQHSDALFPDVDQPKKTHEIPAASCKVISKKLVEITKLRNIPYENYTVGYQLKDVAVIDGIKVNDLTDTARVNVKKVNAKKAYPDHWGNPPLAQTRDLRPLPGGYGDGSSTLAKWITEKMEADKKKGTPTFEQWVKDGKKIPQDMVFPGGTPWFDESTGKNRSAEAVYKMLFGKDAE